jgi:adenylylsulfate kinase
VWITGPPGSGKTTLAAALAERLMALGLDVALLDLLDARGFLLGDRPGLPAEEEILHRVLVCAARLLAEAGVPVIIDATAPRRAWRRLARAEICRFAEVQLVCPRELCAERERAVRWSIGTRGHPAHHRVATPGPEIAIDYETSPEAELIVHTDVRDLTSEVDEILMLTLRLRRRAPADRDRS